MRHLACVVIASALAWAGPPALGADAETAASAWRDADQQRLDRVYAAPGDTYRQAQADHAAATASGHRAQALQALAQQAAAAQWLNRPAQEAVRRRLEALDLRELPADPALAAAELDVLAVRALDRLGLLLFNAALADLDAAELRSKALGDEARLWRVEMLRALVELTQGNLPAEQGLARLDRALQLAPHPLAKATVQVWEAVVRRRVSSLSVDELEKARTMASAALAAIDPDRHQAFATIVLTNVAQGEIALADFSGFMGYYRKFVALTASLQADQGAVYPEFGMLQITAAFRRADLALAVRLQERRVLLTWSLVGGGAVAGLVIMAFAMLSRQRRRLAKLSAQLADSNESLQALSQSRARLLAGACHDLRQPAHALGMLTEVAQMLPRTGPANVATLQRRMGEIRKCSFVLANMLGDLLVMSRLESGNYELRLEPLALDEILQEVQVQFGEPALRKGLTLQVGSSGAYVLSDRLLLRRILFNQVSNAVKYTEQGQVTVRPRVEPGMDSGMVQLEVADTGRGIAPADLERVFDEYVRLDATAAQDGLGIGLSIVRRGCALLGHDLALASEIDRGTRAVITLKTVRPAAASTGKQGEALRFGDGRLIAVMEDDVDSRSAMVALLERWGFEVAGGQQAAEVLDSTAMDPRHPPLLVISDLHLGTEDGLAQVEVLRAWAGNDRLPALLVTGDLGPHIAERAAAAGVRLSHKPMLPSNLRELIGEAMRPQPRSGAAVPEAEAP